MKEKTAKATANSNIALAKYWGKRDPVLNIPAVGSISLTLQALKTKTQVSFDPGLKKDELHLNNSRAEDKKTNRVQRFLDIIRSEAGLNCYARVDSENSFPTGAGLASSASAFAALAGAACGAAGLRPSAKQLSILARKGSGSAARSIFGGFVEMQSGENPDGSDAFACQLADENYWDLRFVVIVTSKDEKETGSTAGMNLTADTSPYYSSWIQSAAADIQSIKRAIEDKDFERLGDITEHSCLKMHALMMSASPALFYWTDTTLSVIQETFAMRKAGVPVYFTIDAGPQVKLITLPHYVGDITDRVKQIPGILNIIHSAAGGGLQLIGGEK